MWMWKVEYLDVSDAEIRLNTLSSNGGEIVQTHISGGDPRELIYLIIIARKLIPGS